MKDYTEYIVEQTQKLLSIDSPTGYTKKCGGLFDEGLYRTGV